MMQLLADHIDQMDLALDQLAMRDRNFDRFALMLIDNVVELTLHQYAQDRSYENDMWGRLDPPRNDPKAVAAALGPRFDAKLKLARSKELINNDVFESIQYLHTFRNTAYHRGLRHEGILHSLALFYFKNACAVLSSYSPMIWSSRSSDQIPYRATKYIGTPNILECKGSFEGAWKRLREVAESMDESLISDLHDDMKETIDRVDEQIQFLADDSPNGKKSRKQVVVECQAWPFAFSEEGKAYLKANCGRKLSVGGYVDWLAANYPWPTKVDPISGWRKRLQSLKIEKNHHLALKKYCEFMSQTEDLLTLIGESASQLDAHIQHLIDAARGK